MDTTPEYIKQCGKATKIQELLNTVSSVGSFISDGVVICIGSARMAPDVWLPRQDQLQEIWRQEYLKRPSKYGWFGEFCNFIGDVYSDYDLMNADEVFESMEQLWLAFVMKELYGKVWNGEEWEVSN